MARRQHPQWHLGFSALLLGAAILAALVVNWQSPSPEPVAQLPPSRPPEKTDAYTLGDSRYAQVETVLDELGIWPELIVKTRSHQSSVDSVSITVPTDLPLEAVNLALTRFISWHGGHVMTGIQRSTRRVDIRCGLDSTATTAFVLRQHPSLQRKAGRIAIVVDDFGDTAGAHGDLFRAFCHISQPLTLAILPNEGDVSAILTMAQERNHEIILHLPMEPDDYPHSDPGDDAIFSHQDDDTIRQLVRRALARVPGAAGINNHMGSRATSDSRVMEAVLSEVKARNLYFLDSRTSGRSAAMVTASALELPAARRDLFIDPVDEDGRVTVATIEGQLWKLADIARDTGQAIGIGHDRRETLRALESTLPRLESRGYRFVPVSELVR